jgi:hypothetical protein
MVVGTPSRSKFVSPRKQRCIATHRVEQQSFVRNTVAQLIASKMTKHPPGAPGAVYESPQLSGP